MLTREQLATLARLERIERTFYPDLETAHFFGTERSPPVTDEMRFVWKMVRDIIMPEISWNEANRAASLRETEWTMVTMKTGGGKTTTCSYFVFWYLRNRLWVEKVVGTTPVYAGDPFLYPFPLRNDNGARLLHPKLEMLKFLRDVDKYRDCIFFFDEVGSLVPGRNFADRRQWWVTTVAKNARRRNIFVVMNEQHPMNLDVLMRENISVVIEPRLDKSTNTFQFAVYQNHDADLSTYMAKIKLNMGRDPQLYPRFDAPEFPFIKLPWFFLFFDTTHEVPPLFQQVMTEQRLGEEIDDFHAWLIKTNPGGVFLNYGEDPPKTDLKNCIDLWNKECEKLYVGDELLQIFMEYRKRYHKEQKEEGEPDIAEQVVNCSKCGNPYLARFIERHESICKKRISTDIVPVAPVKKWGRPKGTKDKKPRTRRTRAEMEAARQVVN